MNIQGVHKAIIHFWLQLIIELFIVGTKIKFTWFLNLLKKVLFHLVYQLKMATISCSAYV